MLISKVGPRDGLQSVKTTRATADKLKWVDALIAAGLGEIEVTAFVPARYCLRWSRKQKSSGMPPTMQA